MTSDFSQRQRRRNHRRAKRQSPSYRSDQKSLRLVATSQSERGLSDRHLEIPSVTELSLPDDRPSKKPLASRRRSPRRQPWDRLPTQLSSKIIGQDAPSTRLATVWGILLLGCCAIAGQLFQLQVMDATTLQQRALSQQVAALQTFTPRRSIVDRQGNVLAIDQPVYSLFAHPILFKRPATEVAALLAPILERSPDQILQQLKSGPSGIRVEFALSESVADRLRALHLDGFELIQHQQRFYPQADLVAEVVGYVDQDSRGQAGVERSQQVLLERFSPEVKVRYTGSGNFLPSDLPVQVLKPDDLQVQLTLDTRLQRIARSALKQQLQRFSAKRGTVIVMDVHSGELLALVSEPTYNPNRYYEAEVERFKNWAVTDLYEPGSTFKPINLAIALSSGAIRADESVYVEGQIHIGPWTIEDFDFSMIGARGTISVTQVLQDSSNVGMVRIMQRLPAAQYYDWLKKLHLGETTQSDLPFETPSQIKDREQFVGATVEPATTAFGQGFSLTPLQMVQLQAAIANGGNLVTPHVVRGLVDNAGVLQSKHQVPPPRKIFTPEASRQVLNMMETVVAQGTGKAAQIPGYRLAGKTGTAQKANPYGGYYANAKITSFVGIFPVEQPQFVVLAVIDEPQGGNAFGGTVAAPIVKSVIQSMIALYGISPNSTSGIVY